MSQNSLTNPPKPSGENLKTAPFKPFAWVLDWLWRDTYCENQDVRRRKQIDWVRATPFISIHLACISIIWVGVSYAAVTVAAILYFLRMFAITGFYHRYFSHRAFQTTRVFQFLMAVVACSAGQRGPLWWAAHHRWHHKHSDQDEDLHSPGLSGFFQSHVGWFLARSAYETPKHFVKDWSQFKELRLLNRIDWIPFLFLGVAVYFLGVGLEQFWPSLQTNGTQLLVWGFLVSTVILYHATYTINSFAHRFGSRRYDTPDDSRNNLSLAILTLGEGWHNNHHHYSASARQGFYWWEIDITYYGLLLLNAVGIIWDLKPVSRKTLMRNRVSRVTGENR